MHTLKMYELTFLVGDREQKVRHPAPGNTQRDLEEAYKEMGLEILEVAGIYEVREVLPLLSRPPGLAQKAKEI